MKPKLLVIPSDPLEAYDKKGYSRNERSEYFNPNSEFEVSLLSVPFYVPSFCNGKLKKFNEYAGFPVYNLDKNLMGLDKILKKIKPDLVRGYSNGADLAIKIGEYLGVPSFVCVHNLFPKKEIKNADRILVVSDEVKEKCLEIGADKNKIKVLYDRVDFDLFQEKRNPYVKKLNNEYSAKYKMISVGRLVKEKNLERLIESSKILKKELGDVKHLHIGDFGDLKENLVNEINKTEHITLLANIEQAKLANFYSWADLFTMASISEGFGQVYIEALACKTPVVTSNIKPMNTYIQNKFNGILVNPYSVESICEGIIKAFKNKKLYYKLKSNARESVKKFDKKSVAKREAQFYKELL